MKPRTKCMVKSQAEKERGVKQQDGHARECKGAVVAAAAAGVVVNYVFLIVMCRHFRCNLCAYVFMCAYFSVCAHVCFAMHATCLFDSSPTCPYILLLYAHFICVFSHAAPSVDVDSFCTVHVCGSSSGGVFSLSFTICTCN